MKLIPSALNFKYSKPTPSCHGSRSAGINAAGAAGSLGGLLASNAAVESCADAVSDRQNNAAQRIKNLRIWMTLPRIPRCERASGINIHPHCRAVSMLIRKRVSRQDNTTDNLTRPLGCRISIGRSFQTPPLLLWMRPGNPPDLHTQELPVSTQGDRFTLTQRIPDLSQMVFKALTKQGR